MTFVVVFRTEHSLTILVFPITTCYLYIVYQIRAGGQPGARLLDPREPARRRLRGRQQRRPHVSAGAAGRPAGANRPRPGEYWAVLRCYSLQFWLNHIHYLSWVYYFHLLLLSCIYCVFISILSYIVRCQLILSFISYSSGDLVESSRVLAPQQQRHQAPWGGAVRQSRPRPRGPARRRSPLDGWLRLREAARGLFSVVYMWFTCWLLWISQLVVR